VMILAAEQASNGSDYAESDSLDWMINACLELADDESGRLCEPGQGLSRGPCL
jgi:hypothetical protein